MKGTIKKLYLQISDLMDEKTFEKEIDRRYEDYEGLLNREAIAYLLVDEMGRSVIETITISTLQDGQNVSTVVTVDEIGKTRQFTRKDGSRGRVVNIHVVDDTGRCRLTLWDKDVEVVDNGEIKKGSIIKVINGYVRDSSFGVEINIGKNGIFAIEAG
jgi:replication factor A1